jgi:hypothetical protein
MSDSLELYANDNPMPDSEKRRRNVRAALGIIRAQAASTTSTNIQAHLANLSQYADAIQAALESKERR